MTIRSNTLRALAAAIPFAYLAACGGGSDPNSPEYKAYEMRHELMEEMGDALLVLNEMSNEERPVDEAEFLAAAQTIVEGTGEVVSTFESQMTVPESRAMPEIWQNWDDFVSHNDTVAEAAEALVMATQSGGFEAGRGLVRGVRDGCGSCHRAYRGPEPD
jgi:cytochrome c556